MDAAEVIQAWESLDGERSTVKALVQESCTYALPRRANVTASKTEGADLRPELFDSTAEDSCERFATGLYNHMWNPSRPNFLLLPPVEGPIGGDVAKPLLSVSETVNEHLAQSNHSEAFFEAGLDLGACGLTTLEVSRGIDSLYEFQTHPFRQVVFRENRRGRVDTVFRRFPWTARQIVQEFGLANVGKSIADAYNQDGGKGRDKTFEIIHAAVPRTEFTGGRRDVLNMPVASVWVSVTDKTLLRTSGWPELRYLVSRFLKASGEKHGRCPGMKCLPDIKMVNKIEETLIVAAEQVVRPSILAPDGSFVSKVRLKPASMLYYRVNPFNPSVKPEPFLSGARVDFGHEYAEAKRDIIKRGWYNDLFLILSDDKRRTATEVRGVLAEKLAMLGPSFGRMKVELFDPKIRILLSILAETSMYLQGVPLEYLQLARIQYISTLAIAMQYAELSMIEDALLFLSPLGEIDPTVFDHLSFDEMVRGFLQKMAWPSKWLRSRDEVTALRERRLQYQMAQAQQLQAQQQMQLMGQLDRRPEDGSPAQMMMEAA